MAATAILALLAGLGATLYFHREAVAQREAAIAEKKRAERQTAIAEAVRNFIVEDIIRAASPNLKVSDKDVTVRDAVDRGTARLEGRFANQPDIEGEMRAELGKLYAELGRLPEQERQFRLAAERFDQALGPADSRTLRAGYSLAYALASQSKQAEALALLQRLDAIAPAAADTRLARTRDVAWAAYHYDRWEIPEAQRRFERALAADDERQPIDELIIANLHLMQDRLDDAQRVARGVIDRLDARGERDTLAGAKALGIVCRAQFFRHDYAGAGPVCAQAVTRLRKIYGHDSIVVADALSIVNRTQIAEGRYAEAVETGRQVHAAWLAGAGAGAVNT